MLSNWGISYVRLANFYSDPTWYGGMCMVRLNVADIVSRSATESTGTEISDVVPRHHINKNRISIKVRACTSITKYYYFLSLLIWGLCDNIVSCRAAAGLMNKRCKRKDNILTVAEYLWITCKLISNEIRGKYYIDLWLISGAAAGHGPYSLLSPPFLLLRPLVYAPMPINSGWVSYVCSRQIWWRGSALHYITGKAQR
jgi:hypothetical protein